MNKKITAAYRSQIRVDQSTSPDQPPSATTARQSGHVACDRNHLSTHSAWKRCPHLGSRRPVSPSLSSEMHTAHSTLPPPPPLSSADARWTYTGSDMRSSFLSPLARGDAHGELSPEEGAMTAPPPPGAAAPS